MCASHCPAQTRHQVPKNWFMKLNAQKIEKIIFDFSRLAGLAYNGKQQGAQLFCSSFDNKNNSNPLSEIGSPGPSEQKLRGSAARS